MIGFKDMTFCSYYEDCEKGGKCDRALTSEVINDALKWMEDPPICLYAAKPECFEEKKDEYSINK